MRDLLYFVLIPLVFIIAYGLAAQAILYPNADLEIELVQSILEKAYFQIYGELYLDEIKGLYVCSLPGRDQRFVRVLYEATTTST